MEIPDRWVVVKLDDGLYKVFASYYGGYLGSDSWRLNSGISKVEEKEKHYDFHGYSGSIYRCHKETYGTSGYSRGVLQNIIDNAAKSGYILEILPEETDFLKLEIKSM